jgi:hypothetical protein
MMKVREEMMKVGEEMMKVRGESVRRQWLAIEVEPGVEGAAEG